MGGRHTLLSTAHVALVVNTARATAGIAVQSGPVGAVGQVEEKMPCCRMHVLQTGT